MSGIQSERTKAWVDSLTKWATNSSWNTQPHNEVPGEPISKRTNKMGQSWSRETDRRSATKEKSSAFYETWKFNIAFYSQKAECSPNSPIVFVWDSYYLPIYSYAPPAASSFRLPTKMFYPFWWIPNPPHFLHFVIILSVQITKLLIVQVSTTSSYFLLRRSKYFSQRPALTFLALSCSDSNWTEPSRVRLNQYAAKQTLGFTRHKSTRHSQTLFDFAGVKVVRPWRKSVGCLAALQNETPCPNLERQDESPYVCVCVCEWEREIPCVLNSRGTISTQTVNWSGTPVSTLSPLQP
jgi:hypothetical protein